jgi:hypothetical protein
MSKSMMLITSTWSTRKTFKLVPISQDAVYNEGIYDPENKVLALISKDKKQSMHMLPKLNEFGDVQYLKIGKRANGKDFAEERKPLESFYEYYIEEADEIKAIINLICVNANEFDVNKFMNPEPAEPQSNIITAGI